MPHSKMPQNCPKNAPKIFTLFGAKGAILD